MKDKKKMWVFIAIAVAVVLLFYSSGEDKATKSSQSSNETFTYSSSGGGGGGVPPSGDPDEPCENCDLFWVENSLSEFRPGFEIDEYLTKDGRLVPEQEPGTGPTGHWECRGDCPDMNGYPQTCRPRPVFFDPAEFNDLPRSKTELGQLMDCYCELEEECHLEYGNIFCERGIPENILDDILVGDNEGRFMGIEYTKIREHCGIARCEGGCRVTGERCVLEVEKGAFGDTFTSCTCQGDDCRKVLNIQPSQNRIRTQTNYGVQAGDTVRVRDYVDMQIVQGTYNIAFHCEGGCIDRDKEC